MSGLGFIAKEHEMLTEPRAWLPQCDNCYEAGQTMCATFPDQRECVSCGHWTRWRAWLPVRPSVTLDREETHQAGATVMLKVNLTAKGGAS